jgi:hypothetical protein
MIMDEIGRTVPRNRLRAVLLPIGEGQLITSNNAELISDH